MEPWGVLYLLQSVLSAKLLIPTFTSKEPWTNPCAGTSMSLLELSMEYSYSLENILKRMDVKLEKLTIDMEIYQRKLVMKKFKDTDFLNILKFHPKLIGFPSIHKGTNDNIMETLLDCYSQLSVVIAYLEYVPFYESNKELHRVGKKLLHDCLEVLCELRIAMKSNYVEVEHYVSENVVPRIYRHLTRSDRASWSYILIRDITDFVRQMRLRIQLLSFTESLH